MSLAITKTTTTVTTTTITTTITSPSTVSAINTAITSSLTDSMLSPAKTAKDSAAGVKFAIAALSDENLDDELIISEDMIQFSEEDKPSKKKTEQVKKKLSGAQRKKIRALWTNTSPAKPKKFGNPFARDGEAGTSNANQRRTFSQTLGGRSNKRDRSSETTPPVNPPSKVAKTPASVRTEERGGQPPSLLNRLGTRKPNNVQPKLQSDQGLQMAIVLDDGVCGRIPTETLKSLNDCIARAIDSGSSSPTAVEPRLESARIVNGRFAVTCWNQESADWLRVQVAGPEFCAGTSLTLVELSKVPKERKVTVHIPGVPEEYSVVCRRLPIQNKVLKTDKWRLLGQKKKASWQLLTIGMDEDSVTELIVRSFLSYWKTQIPSCQPSKK